MLPQLKCALLLAISLALFSACACGSAEPVSGSRPTSTSTERGGSAATTSKIDPLPARSTPGKTPVLGYNVIASYPHDRHAFTQGLLIVDGRLYESTGKDGESTVRLVELETGEVLKRRNIEPSYFGEGLASVGGLLYQLTWEKGKALLYDRSTLRPLSYEYTYPGEGWGLTTNDDDELIMSDGTEFIRVLDPMGMKEKRRIKVTDQGRAILHINELEWIDGEIWANVWKTDRIARIDPDTGKVNAWVDLSGILGTNRVTSPVEDVLNGIAYDAETKKLYVTGKRWPFLFHIQVE